MWVVCGGQPSAGNEEKAVYASADGGLTWSLRSAAETWTVAGDPKANCPDMDMSVQSTLSHPRALTWRSGDLASSLSPRTAAGPGNRLRPPLWVETVEAAWWPSWTQPTAGPFIFPLDCGEQLADLFGRRLTARPDRDDAFPDSVLARCSALPNKAGSVGIGPRDRGAHLAATGRPL